MNSFFSSITSFFSIGNIPLGFYPIIFIGFLVFYIAGLNLAYHFSMPNMKKTPSLKGVLNGLFLMTVLCGIGFYYFYNAWSNAVDHKHLTNIGWMVLVFSKLGAYGYTGVMLGRFIKRNQSTK